MQAERDWLWDFVFPAIEERLRRHCRHLEWIGLRLGAVDAQAENDAMGADAARYADAYSPASDEGAPDRVARLDKLKDRIRREFPGHVHTYPAAWDEAAGRVTRLEAFGKRVEEALWQQLEAELAAEAEPAGLPWQVREAPALEPSAADRRRDFQGPDGAARRHRRAARRSRAGRVHFAARPMTRSGTSCRSPLPISTSRRRQITPILGGTSTDASRRSTRERLDQKPVRPP